MKLYGYWRSGAAWRVRIALNLKGLAYEHASVHLTRDGGEQKQPAYRAVNPQGRVPTLELDDGTRLIQSPAILEWLEEAHPNPPLLPNDPLQRAKVRGVAALIGCDIHPLNNTGPLNYLRQELAANKDAVQAWIAHWITDGFRGVEALIEGGEFCFGKSPTLADLYLVPQAASARRFNVPLDAYPKIVRVADACAKLDAFRKAAPENQPDAEQ